MHELGIVVHVIKQIEEIAEKNKVQKVVELTLEVGEVSGVVKEYFVDAFNWSIKKTKYMQDCKLNYVSIKGITYCENCGKTYDTVANGITCPYCGSTNTYLVIGKEVQIKDIKVI